ncbi:MAG: oxygen-independent coproporphyrinogen III oxidase [Bacteroidales bacterium]|nr:oxygen-independent coproporphyrinogen III oxidase [Bacteroidales bacterium]
MSLVEKYNVSVPRYTSYPPANFFRELQPSDYLEAVSRSNNEGTKLISFYIHMPFCRRLCHYCGCNSYIMPSNGDTVNRYIEAIHKEIDIVAAHLDKSRPISQIHFGGGSPTAMPVSVLKEVNDHLLSLFPTIEKPEIAVECHPGYLTESDWQQLTESHFNRFSLGIQDLNDKVLDAVGRTPSNLPLDVIMTILRQAGATVNMDFLFGLPYQTADSFAKNIERAIELRPDRLVTFSYGHVPWVFKRQMILEKHGLPATEEKQRMYEVASAMLHEAGYKSIGLDHFVLPDDELYRALEAGLLYRNFQGYCTRRTTGQVYAFGATGISQLDSSYAQNTKVIDEYVNTTLNGVLTTTKGYLLTEQERIAKEVIERLMCNYRISWSELASTMGISIDQVKSALHYEESQLNEMASDGIITISADGMAMTDEGHPFVRNVAAALDPLMQNTDKKFSKPI